MHFVRGLAKLIDEDREVGRSRGSHLSSEVLTAMIVFHLQRLDFAC